MSHTGAGIIQKVYPKLVEVMDYISNMQKSDISPQNACADVSCICGNLEAEESLGSSVHNKTSHSVYLLYIRNTP